MEQKLTYPKDYSLFKKELLAKYTTDTVNDIARSKLISYRLKEAGEPKRVFAFYLSLRNEDFSKDFRTQYSTILTEITKNEIAPFFSKHSPSHSNLDHEEKAAFESQKNTDILILFEALCTTWKEKLEDYEPTIVAQIKDINGTTVPFIGSLRQGSPKRF